MKPEIYSENSFFPEAIPVLIPENWQNTFEQINELASFCQCSVIDTRQYLNQPDVGETIKRWAMTQEIKKPITPIISRLIEERVNQVNTPLEKAQARYDVEYANANELINMLGSTNPELNQLIYNSLQSGVNYSFWSPLMIPQFFSAIVGKNMLNVNASIVNAGSGSGDFEKKLLDYGFKNNQLVSTDISAASTRRLKEMGIRTLQGRLENLTPKLLLLSAIPVTDLVFLSYFIDRDENQKKTLEAALELLSAAGGGKLIFEGLLPAQPIDPAGISYVDSENNMITKGIDPVEDLRLICEAIIELGQNQGCQMVIKNIAAGTRYVFSRDGLEELATYFIAAEDKSTMQTLPVR